MLPLNVGEQRIAQRAGTRLSNEVADMGLEKIGHFPKMRVTGRVDNLAVKGQIFLNAGSAVVKGFLDRMELPFDRRKLLGRTPFGRQGRCSRLDGHQQLDDIPDLEGVGEINPCQAEGDLLCFDDKRTQSLSLSHKAVSFERADCLAHDWSADVAFFRQVALGR